MQAREYAIKLVVEDGFEGALGEFSDKKTLRDVVESREDVAGGSKLLLSVSHTDPAPMPWNIAQMPVGKPFVTVREAQGDLATGEKSPSAFRRRLSASILTVVTSSILGSSM